MTAEALIRNRNIAFGGPLSKRLSTPRGIEEVGCGGVTVLKIDDITTDHLIRVSDLLTDDLLLLGYRALCGIEGWTPGMLKSRQSIVLGAGEQFGRGSSREQAVWALLKAGISAVIAKSFGPIFLKNASYLGLLTSTNLTLLDRIQEGEVVPFEEFINGKDPLLQQILLSGGLFPYLKKIREDKKLEPSINRTENEPTTPMNIWQKRLAKAFRVKDVRESEVGMLTVDQAYSYDVLSALVRSVMLQQFEKVNSVLDPRKIHLFEDHFGSSTKPEIPGLMKTQQQFASELKIPPGNYHSSNDSNSGICHRVMLGLIDPRISQVVIATDSHTPTIGALPIVALPVGSTLFAAAIAEGRIPFSVPPVVRVELKGKLPKGFSIRDAQFALAVEAKKRMLPGGMFIEFGGEGLNTLSFDQVLALCNMVPEVFNAESAITEAFDAGIKFLEERWGITRDEALELYGQPDPGCTYNQETITFNLDDITTSWISKPGNPPVMMPLGELVERPHIDKAYLASCTLGYDDLVEAAAVLKDKKVADGTKLVVVVSSQEVRDKAHQSGILQILEEAGAIISENSTCGPCIGEGIYPVNAGEVAISATNRNFSGRMGEGKVYLGGALLTSISAVLGHIPTIEEYNSEIDRIIENIEAMN